MKEYCFPYKKEPSRTFGLIDRPVIETLLKTKEGRWFKVFPYTDSGADFTIFPKSVCKVLGLKLKEGQKSLIGGISGGPLTIYIHTVEMKIGDREFRCRVGFAMKEDISYLLGRMHVLDNFDIRFEKTRVCFVERDG